MVCGPNSKWGKPPYWTVVVWIRRFMGKLLPAIRDRFLIVNVELSNVLIVLGHHTWHSCTSWAD